VAELAGLPKNVLKRSREILKELEKTHHNSTVALLDKVTFGHSQLNFLEAPIEMIVPEHLTFLEQDLKNLDILNITPLQALQKLHDLKTRITD
jgi:DNA mismatch repair protein MutS